LSSGAATANTGQKRYQGIAYDAKTQSVLGNISADLKYPSETKVRGNLEFSRRKGYDVSRLKGEIPEYAKADGIPYNKLPDNIERPSKEEQRKKLRKRREKSRKRSIHLLKGKIPIKGEIPGRNKGDEKYFKISLGGQFNKKEVNSMVKVNDTGGQVIGEFKAPNGRQRIGFTLLPPESSELPHPTARLTARA
jgi:hypothetical protein